MGERKARIGIVGLGGMGRRHCTAVAGHPELELAAVCDMRPDAVSQVLAEHPGVQGYTGWQSMLKTEALDLLVIATNGPSHAEIALAAVEAGVPRILCEKPMATSLRDARTMITACQARRVQLAVNHSYRWVPAYIRLRELLRADTIGRLRHISFTRGSGQLACLGIHLFDLFRMLTDAEPVRVLGFLDRTGTPNPRGTQFEDPGAYGMIWFSNGVRAWFEQSEDYGLPLQLEIVGEVGHVSISENNNDWQVWARSEFDRLLPMTRRPKLMRVPFDGEPVDLVVCSRAAMLELLDTGAILSSTGEDGYASLQMVVAVHVSDKAGNVPVDLPLDEASQALQFTFT